MKNTNILTVLAAGVCTLSAVAAGVQTTLKATNPKGLVFAGWYGGDGLPLAGGADYRSPSLPYAMPDSESAVWARYALAQDDADSLGIDVEDSYGTSGAFDLTLNVRSLSFPKVAVSGLPAGLKFDAKSLRIYGTAKKPGTYTVTAKLTNASVKKAVERKFTIVVDNLTGANELLRVSNAAGGATALRNARGEKYVISAGVSEFDLPVLNAANGADKLALSGLPSGLKYNAKTGKVEGVATKAGAYTVTATVKAGKTTSVSTFTVEVKALPAWAVGTFAGCGEYVSAEESDPSDDAEAPIESEIAVSANRVNGTVTIAANGKLSGKFLLDDPINERTLTASFSARSLAGYDAAQDTYWFDAQVLFKMGRETVDAGTHRLYLAAKDYNGEVKIGRIYAEDEDFALDFAQNIWKVKGFADKPTFAQKTVTLVEQHNIFGDDETEGTSTVTLVLNQNGTVSFTMLDEGVDAGVKFRDRVSGKADLTVTGYVESEDGDYYTAVIPVSFSDGLMKIKVQLGLDEDGKVYTDGSKITYIDEFADWSV